MRFWFAWFGVLIGAVSIFSMSQTAFGFGLAQIFKDLIEFYRAAFHPVADFVTSGLRWLLSLLSIPLPYISPDIVVTYILIGAAFFRFTFTPATQLVPINPVIYFLLHSLIWPHSLIRMLIKIYRKNHWMDRKAGYLWLLEIGKMVLGFVALFVTNAYFFR
jgi:hypothetical protein